MYVKGAVKYTEQILTDFKVVHSATKISLQLTIFPSN